MTLATGYWVVDVSGYLNRESYFLSSVAMGELDRLHREGWAVFANCPIGREAASRAQDEAAREFANSSKQRARLDV